MLWLESQQRQCAHVLHNAIEFRAHVHAAQGMHTQRQLVHSHPKRVQNTKAVISLQRTRTTDASSMNVCLGLLDLCKIENITIREGSERPVCGFQLFPQYAC